MQLEHAFSIRKKQMWFKMYGTEITKLNFLINVTFKTN